MVQAHARELLNQKEATKPVAKRAGEHPLFTATERLVTALDRLEDKLERLPKTVKSRDEKLIFFEQENETLRQERESLNAAIEQLKSRYNDLHKVASAIYSKLDDSIKRLTQIVGN